MNTVFTANAILELQLVFNSQLNERKSKPFSFPFFFFFVNFMNCIETSRGSTSNKDSDMTTFKFSSELKKKSR